MLSNKCTIVHLRRSSTLTICVRMCSSRYAIRRFRPRNTTAGHSSAGAARLQRVSSSGFPSGWEEHDGGALSDQNNKQESKTRANTYMFLRIQQSHQWSVQGHPTWFRVSEIKFATAYRLVLCKEAGVTCFRLRYNKRSDVSFVGRAEKQA